MCDFCNRIIQIDFDINHTILITIFKSPIPHTNSLGRVVESKAETYKDLCLLAWVQCEIAAAKMTTIDVSGTCVCGSPSLCATVKCMSISVSRVITKYTTFRYCC